MNKNNKFTWNEGDFTVDSSKIDKSHLRVIHYASDSDLPQSVKDKVQDSVAQNIFRQALNSSLANGKSEMHSFIASYKALESAGYSRDEQDNWVSKQGGPCGIGLPGEDPPNSEDYLVRPQVLNTDSDDISAYMEYLESLAKSNPTLQQSHVNKPLGSEWPIVGVNQTDPNQSTVLVGDDSEEDPDDIDKGGPGSGPQGGGHTGVLTSAVGSKVTVNKPSSPHHGEEGTVLRQVGHDHAVDFKGGSVEWLHSGELIKKSDPDDNQDDINKGGPGSGPRAQLTALQDKHDLLKEHPARSGSPHTAATNKFGQSVESLSRQVQDFSSKNAGVLLNARPLMKTKIETAEKLLTAASRQSENWSKAAHIDTALSHLHLAIRAASKAMGSKWVGKSAIAKRISGQSDIHLNGKGKALASKLGVRIADKGCFDILYSSPLNRGKETAHEILEACPNTTYATPSQALQPWHLGAFEGKE
jgi:cation transport regulator ChaB